MEQGSGCARFNGVRRGLSCLLAVVLVWGLPGPWPGGADRALADEPSPVVLEDLSTPAPEGGQADGDAMSADSPSPSGESGEDAVYEEGSEGAVVESDADAVGSSEAITEDDPEGPTNVGATVAAESDETEGDGVASQAFEGEGYVPGQIVVVYEEGASPSRQAGVARLLGAGDSPDTVSLDSGDVALLDIADDVTVEEAVRAARTDEAVKYAVPNYRAVSYEKGAAQLEGNASPAASSDPDQKYQWYLDAVRAPGAWIALSKTATAPVKVAVLDTGASLSHPDLKNVVNRTQSREIVWTADHSRYSLRSLRGDGYTNGSAGIEIPSTHGTHVAGIIAAQANNGGILGVASGGATAKANQLVDLVAIDIFSENVYIDGRLEPNATLYDVVVGLNYARDIGCSVVNMSLGFIESDAELAAFLNDFCTELTTKNNMVIVCAAGNESTASPSYPAACRDDVGVISVGQGLTRSSFSNYGAWCNLSAPGENIYSTILADDKVTNSYAAMDGTSMAAPVVTASAALVRAANSDLSAREVSNVLCATAKDIYAAGYDGNSGYGVVDAEKAVQRAVALNTNVWKTIGGKRYYYGADGRPVKWSQKIDGSWYYFNGSGAMQTGWITWKDGTKSYFDWDGRALLGWRSFNGVKYYFDESTGISRRWSQKIDGKWYYFDGKSVMQKGWITWKDGTKSYFHPDARGHAGALTGWRSFNGVKYYFDESTGISRRWSQTIDGYWYYFDSASRMKKGWVTWNDGKKSYFDASGRAVTGWQTIGGKRYYFDPATYKTSGPASQQTPGVARTVYWVASGEVYHTTRDCVSLKRSKNILSGTIAQSGKKRVCGNCG